MAKRVGVLLSGCGRLDGSDISESILTLEGKRLLKNFLEL